MKLKYGNMYKELDQNYLTNCTILEKNYKMLNSPEDKKYILTNATAILPKLNRN